MPGDVFLVGASVRALAQSAARSGFRVHAADLFGDADLRRVACSVDVLALEKYPAGFADLHQPAMPSVYTGGLENHPALLARLQERGPLWGNGAREVAGVRDVRRLHDELGRVGLEVPRVWASSPPAGTACVVKSPVSTGGLGVELWKGDAVSADCHLQEYVPGPSLASVFLLTPSGAHLVGTTRQILARDLLGEAFVPREPFRYVGSVGPEIVTTTERVVLERLGRCLQGAFGLRGLVGVDWVRSSQGVSIIEVNPRYTASIEILERAADQPLFGHHAAAFDAAIPVGPLPTIETTGRWGKLVLYAPSSGRLDASAPCFADDHCFADIPTIATCHPAGQPILTLLARVPKDGDPLAELCRKASDFLARHFVSTGEEPRCTP